MDFPTGDAPEPVLLIMADISGYTRFMTANAKTLAHSQTIITELMQAIIEQIKLPLEVAKLEGDAVFLFCRKQKGSQPWPETKQIIRERLFTFFSMFSEKVAELSRSTTCTCSACTHIEGLRLKVIVHSGEALFHRVLNFVELAGIDVILVHRLLKNSVKADQYLLLTRQAWDDLEFPGQTYSVEGAETYEDIGHVSTIVCLSNQEQPEAYTAAPLPFGRRFGESMSLYWKLWFAPFASYSGAFRNIASGTSAPGRFGFAVLTAVLTPIFPPVGTLFVFLHSLQPASNIKHVNDHHEHRPDGSCCKKS